MNELLTKIEAARTSAEALSEHIDNALGQELVKLCQGKTYGETVSTLLVYAAQLVARQVESRDELAFESMTMVIFFQAHLKAYAEYYEDTKNGLQ